VQLCRPVALIDNFLISCAGSFAELFSNLSSVNTCGAVVITKLEEMAGKKG